MNHSCISMFPTYKSLVVESLLELFDTKSVGVSLPSQSWSSDHIAVKVQYQLGFRLIGFRVYKSFNIS